MRPLLSRVEPEYGVERFRRLLSEPDVHQRRVLRGILARNADCEFGRLHGFADIDSFDRYRERVPITSYDALRSPIERMACGEAGVLTGEPVCAWEETGGSGAGAKLVPYTASGLREFRAGLLPWLDALYAAWPACATGRAYWAVSPVGRGGKRTPSGIPIGLPDAAYLGESRSAGIASTPVVPAQVGGMRDLAAWRRVTALHLVACADLTLISVWSPTFLLELLGYIEREAQALAATLREGRADLGGPTGIDGEVPLPTPDPARADLLLQAARGGSVDWQALWPALTLISCWDQARARSYAERLRPMFPHAFVQGKGLLATEALVSIPLQAGHDPVLAIESGYYEFVDGAGRARTACELDVGGQYELLLTTASGLYRYAIGDRVRVSGYLERTPTLEFLGRSGVQSDLCGEKLDEPFVAQAIGASGVRFGMLVPRRTPPGYWLILDASEHGEQSAQRVAEATERALCVNPQYAYARGIGQLMALEARRVEAPLARWTNRGIKRGQRLGVIKLPALHPDDEGIKIFDTTP